MMPQYSFIPYMPIYSCEFTKFIEKIMLLLMKTLLIHIIPRKRKESLSLKLLKVTNSTTTSLDQGP